MNEATDQRTSQHDAKEIKIPLSHGYIAAKEWGIPSGNRCLALHGWQDNAGSFDMLIPFLSPSLYIIAIDIIGHGRSSHKPVGAPYFYLEFIYHVKCIAYHLNWSKFTIIGHSLGSSVGLVFSSLHTEMIDKLICIDLIKPLTYPANNISSRIKNNLQEFENAEKNTADTQPSYNEDEAIKRLIEGRGGAISESSARILSKRGTRKLDDGRFVFSRDFRIRDIWCSGLNCFNVMAEVISGIKCDLLIIKAKDSPTYSDQESLEYFLEIYRKQCSRFELVEIDGNHFIHLEQPEQVAQFINNFLLQKHSSL